MWTSVLKRAIVKYVLVACWLADCVAVCGCQNSDSAMDKFEKWQLPRIEQNIRMGRHPYDGVINAYGVIP
jgi:hypothetical protein